MYNQSAYLHSAIASVVNGTCRNLEIIVTNELGSDVNRETAAGFGDTRIVYHRNQAMSGAGSNHFQAFRE